MYELLSIAGFVCGLLAAGMMGWQMPWRKKLAADCRNLLWLYKQLEEACNTHSSAAREVMESHHREIVASAWSVTQAHGERLNKLEEKCSAALRSVQDKLSMLQGRFTDLEKHTRRSDEEFEKVRKELVDGCVAEASLKLSLRELYAGQILAQLAYSTDMDDEDRSKAVEQAVQMANMLIARLRKRGELWASMGWDDSKKPTVDCCTATKVMDGVTWRCAIDAGHSGPHSAGVNRQWHEEWKAHVGVASDKKTSMADVIKQATGYYPDRDAVPTILDGGWAGKVQHATEEDESNG